MSACWRTVLFLEITKQQVYLPKQGKKDFGIVVRKDLDVGQSLYTNTYYDDRENVTSLEKLL